MLQLLLETRFPPQRRSSALNLLQLESVWLKDSPLQMQAGLCHHLHTLVYSGTNHFPLESLSVGFRLFSVKAARSSWKPGRRCDLHPGEILVADGPLQPSSCMMWKEMLDPMLLRPTSSLTSWILWSNHFLCWNFLHSSFRWRTRAAHPTLKTGFYGLHFVNEAVQSHVLPVWMKIVHEMKFFFLKKLLTSVYSLVFFM